MSDDLNEFMSDDAPGGQPSGGGLRAKLEAQLAENRELKSRLAQLEASQAERAAADVWKELGVPARFQKAYLGPKDPEAMKQWWAELAVPEALLGDVSDDQPQESNEQREQREALQSFQQAGQMGISSNGTGGHLAEANQVAAKGRGASSADRDALYSKMGIPDF